MRCLDLRDMLRSPGCNELAADALEVLAAAGRHVALPSSPLNPGPDPDSSPGPGGTDAAEHQPALPGIGQGPGLNAEPALEPSSAPESTPALLRALGSLLQPGRAPLRLAAAAARALAAVTQAPGASAAVGACLGALRVSHWRREICLALVLRLES